MVEQLVAKLVEFEQVDLGDDGFLRDTDIANAFLRGVTAMTSSGEDSKLRVLSMPGFESSTGFDSRISEAVAEARKSLTVNLLGFRARYILIDSFDEDEEDNGDEEEVEKSIHSDDEDSSSSAS